MIGRTLAAAVATLLCTIAISAQAQQALSLTASPASGPAPLTVTFTVSPMPPTDSAIDFGDGAAAGQLRRGRSSTASVTHVYQTNGRFVARLSAGASVVGNATISVGQ